MPWHVGEILDICHGSVYARCSAPAYRNGVIHDARPPVEGAQGSSLIQHLGHVARRDDVWYVANGWLHCYRYGAEHAQIERQR